MDNNGAIIEEEKTSINFKNPKMDKIRRSFVCLTIISLLWLIIIFVVTIFSNTVFTTLNKEIDNSLSGMSGEYSPGQEVMVVGLGFAKIFSVFGVFAEILFALLILVIAIIYLIPACITWVLAGKKNKNAVVANYFCIVIHWFVVLFLLLPICNITFALFLFFITGLVIGVVNIIYTEKYRLLFVKKSDKHVNIDN